MADEVERQLLAKLTDVIKKIESTEESWLARNLGRFPNKFKKLQQSLSTSTNPGAPRPIRETLYNLDNLLSEWQMESKKLSLLSVHSIFKFGRQIDRIKNDILYQTKNNSTRVLPQGPPQIQTRDIQPTDNEINPVSTELEFPKLSTRYPDAEAHGLDDKVMCLERMLILRRESNDTEFKAIGLVGMRGVGKTMLCQQIFKQERVQNYFLPRIWVCLSRQREDDQDHKKEVVKRMLRALGVEKQVIDYADADAKSLETLLFVLRLQLVGKRYLIVLDDAWNSGENGFFSGLAKDEKLSQKLAYGFPKGSGGTVIITTRSKEIAKYMVGDENSHCLVPVLESESCWSIFKDEAEKGGDELPPDLVDLREEIIKKCGGLPLAAKLMGQIARENPAGNTELQDDHSQIQLVMEQPVNNGGTPPNSS